MLLWICSVAIAFLVFRNTAAKILEVVQIAKAWLGTCSNHDETTLRVISNLHCLRIIWNKKITCHYLTVIRIIILPCNLPEVCSCCEGFQLCNREDTQKAFSTSEVVVSNCSIVLLPCCVQYINLDFFPIQNHLFPVAVCFGGLIIFNKLEKITIFMIKSHACTRQMLLFGYKGYNKHMVTVTNKHIYFGYVDYWNDS